MEKTTKKKPYFKALLLGVLSIASYIFLFTHLEYVMDNFLRGGIYAALPIITAFYFSLVHGSFASTVLSVIGISAKGSSH